jgi:hypothetical protein
MKGLDYSLGKEGDFIYLEGLLSFLDFDGLIPVYLGIDGEFFFGDDLLSIIFLIFYCLKPLYCLHYEGCSLYCAFYTPLLCKNYAV